MSLSGLLPYEHQSFAQGSVWAYNCYWYLSKCVFSSHLQPHSVSAQSNDPSVLLPLEQSTRLPGKESAALTAVPWWSLLPNGLLLQLEWEPWLGPPSFQTGFLEQKTEKGFHSSNKMDLSLLVTPSERWGWSFSLVHLPISLTLSFLSPVNMKNKWLNTKKKISKTPKYVIWENEPRWSPSFKNCIKKLHYCQVRWREARKTALITDAI